MGVLCTLVSFTFIFQPCPISEASGETQAIYYSVLAMVNCFGWASQQVIIQETRRPTIKHLTTNIEKICHLSLITNMSACQNERTGLASIR